MGELALAITVSDVQKLKGLLNEIVQPTVSYDENQLNMANDVIAKNRHAANCASDILERYMKAAHISA